MSRGYVRMEYVIFIFILALAGLILLTAFFSARIEARDKIRIADATQIHKAIALYFQENGVYPPSQDGRPAGMDNYLETWPVAPTADGGCSEVQNTYTYVQKSSGQDYVFTLCLGRANGDWRSGFQTLGPNGIK